MIVNGFELTPEEENLLLEPTVFPEDEFPDPEQVPEDLGEDQDELEETEEEEGDE